MARTDEDAPDVTPPPSEAPEPPYQALFPNLDRLSPEAFRAGTLSRRRITRALAGLAVVAAVTAALIAVSTLPS